MNDFNEGRKGGPVMRHEHDPIHEGDIIVFRRGDSTFTSTVVHVSVDMLDGSVWYHTGRSSVQDKDIIDVLPGEA